MERVIRDMLPLYRDPHFTFRFAEDRIIARFHLEGVEAGRRVTIDKIDPVSGERLAGAVEAGRGPSAAGIDKIDPVSGERLGLLATAAVGNGGWVDLSEPVVVRAGEAFIAVPERSASDEM